MSDSPVILTWNFTNWITVVLMVILGVGAFKMIHAGAKKMAAKQSAKE